MATAYGNRISFTTPTTGTGTVNVGTALANFQVPPISVASGSTLGYTIVDGANWEVGTGVYTTGSPATLSRVTVEDSSSGAGVLQNLSGNATVSIVVTAAMYSAWASTVSPAFTGTPTALTAAAGTSTTQIATTAFAATALNCIGRNKIHNPMMNNAQRGTGTFTTAGIYTLDRWGLAFGSFDSVSVSRAQYTDANRTSLGDQEANNNLTAVVTGSANAAAYVHIWQGIENVRRLSNKTVTVSFWAHAALTAKLGVGLRQYFGTGGSPSANVDLNTTTISLSTGPARYSATFTLPSVAGKTLGTNNDHYTRLAFFFSSGVNNSALCGVPQQSTTFILSGIQLEIGPIASPLEKLDSFADLANCQRFYQIGNFTRDGYIANTIVDSAALRFPVPMRAAPSVTPTFTTQTNCASSTTTGITVNGFSPQTTGSGTGAFVLIGSFTATADLAASGTP